MCKPTPAEDVPLSTGPRANFDLGGESSRANRIYDFPHEHPIVCQLVELFYTQVRREPQLRGFGHSIGRASHPRSDGHGLLALQILGEREGETSAV